MKEQDDFDSEDLKDLDENADSIHSLYSSDDSDIDDHITSLKTDIIEDTKIDKLKAKRLERMRLLE